ncbi:MAG: hypothetical protein AAF533_06765 [Acidobacteriota bacterium]
MDLDDWPLTHCRPLLLGLVVLGGLSAVANLVVDTHPFEERVAMVLINVPMSATMYFFFRRLHRPSLRDSNWSRSSVQDTTNWFWVFSGCSLFVLILAVACLVAGHAMPAPFFLIPATGAFAMLDTLRRVRAELDEQASSRTAIQTGPSGQHPTP